MVKFQPLTKEQASRVFPKGEYKAAVESCVLGKSKAKQQDMFTVNVRVYGPDGRENLVRDYLLCDGPMAYKLRHFCESMGKLEDYESGELYPETFQGENVVVKLAIEEDDDYPDKNVIKDYIVPGAKKPVVDPAWSKTAAKQAEAKKQNPKAERPPPDEIPF